MDGERIAPPETQPSKKRSFDAMGREFNQDDAAAAAMWKQEQHQRRQQRQPPTRSTANSPECGDAAPLPRTEEAACSSGQPAPPAGEARTKREEDGGACGGQGEEVAAVAGAANAGGAAERPSESPEKQSLHQAEIEAATSGGASGMAPSPPTGSPATLPPASSERPLSPDDIRKFEEDGFVMLKRAFEPEVAAACRECLWKRLQGEGIRRDQPATWVRKQGIAEIYGTSTSSKKRRGRPWTDALSQRLKSAIDQLAGIGKWEEFGCGWWMITFPGFAEPPWGAEGKWHIDGAHFRHYPHSREIGILPIFLFSDVRPQGGGTAVLRGSHKKVAEILWNRAGRTGLKGPQLSSAAREALLPPAVEDVIETNGEAGDVLLTHPLLLHARSTNLAPMDESGVRFMCHPAVPLKCHLDLKSAPETFTILERVMWRARSAGGESPDVDAESIAGTGGGEACPMSPVIYTPAQCDHSPVELRSTSKGHKRNSSGQRGRQKGKGQSRGTGASLPQQGREDQQGQPTAVVVPNAMEQQRQVDQQQRQQPAANTADRGQPHTEVESPVVRSGSPGVEGGEQAAGGASPAMSSCDDTTCFNKLDGRGEIVEEDRNGYDDVPAIESDAHEEVDSAVLAAMGFGGFGGPRG